MLGLKICARAPVVLGDVSWLYNVLQSSITANAFSGHLFIARDSHDEQIPQPDKLDFTRRVETGIGGGVKSPKIGRGVKVLNFRGPLKLTPPFCRDSIENPQFGGEKS